MYLYETNNITNFKKFTTSELSDVLEILTLYNKNIYCITSIIFQIYYREFQTMVGSKNCIYSENTNLKRLSKYIQYLSSEGRFCKDKFRTMWHKIMLEDQVTLQILWWLDQNNLIYFEEYWAMKPTSNIILQLETFISSIEENFTSAEQKEKQYIGRNIFLKLLLSLNSQTSSAWCKRSQNIFEIYMNKALEELVFHPNNAKLIGFIKMLSDTDTFYGTLIKDMCRSIIRKLISCEEKVNICNAIEKQQQWSTNHLKLDTLTLYFELVKRLTLVELFDIIQEVPENNLNWRLVLTFVAVFIRKVQDSYKHLKSMISRQLQSVFSEMVCPGVLVHASSGTEVQVLAGVVMARAACLEQSDPDHEYSEWVAHTWGAHSVQRCGTSPGAWARLQSALQVALPFEPPWTLAVHIARNLRAPPKHHHDMLVYKDQCRIRLQALTTASSSTSKSIENSSDSEDFCT